MTDGGGDAPPPTAETGGDFLLQLLQKRPHHHHQPQAPPPPPHHLFDTSSRAPPAQSLADDPAVAAFGPSLNFPPPRASNVHDLSPAPHGLDNTLSPPPPYQPHFTGFPQNPPWSVPPGFPFNNGPNMPRAPQLPLNHRLNGEDDLGKLGFSRTDCRGNPVNRSEHKLMFGSFSSEIRTQEGSSNRNASLGADRDGLLPKFNMSKEGEVSVGNGSFNEQVRNRQFDLGPQNLNAFGQSGSGYRQHQEKFSRQPPPGFTNKPPGFPNRPREMGNWDSSGHRKGLEHRKMHGDSVELGLSEQIDRPGVPSDSVSDVEESLMDLHSEQIAIGDGPSRGIRDRTRRNVGGRASHQFDDLSEHFNDSLGLDGGLDGRNDWGRATSSRRDRDVRSDIRGQRLISQKMRNIKRHMKCRRDIDGLNASFLAIYKSLTPSEEEKAKQKLLLTLLEKLVCKEWPNARLYLYGSCANSFGVSKSDIDVCLAIEDADIEKSEVLLRLADILQSDSLQNVQALTRARVPIVKLMDPETGLSCDICINNVLAVVNTKLLRDYAEIDVRLRQLAFIVKHWAKTRGVNVTYQGTLSSYAYVIMCINFLQLRKPAILPCLQGMEATYSVTIDDVHYAFFDQVDELRDFGSANRESIAQLVWAFFNYWAYHHDYTNEVISIRTGSIISKRAKDWTRRVGNDRHLICIEDPFEVSHDLGRVVDKFSIRVLREEFERAAYIMQCDPNPCKTLFEPYIPC